jgi:hypothetical protein
MPQSQQIYKRHLPINKKEMKKYFIPTIRVWYILGGILLFVLAMSLLNFPITSFMSISPDASAKFELGWPTTFLSIDLMNPNSVLINWITLILSLIGYYAFAYIIDITISLVMDGLKKPMTPEEIFTQARKAYFYHKSQGMEEEKIKELFKKQGWKDEDIEKLK